MKNLDDRGADSDSVLFRAHFSSFAESLFSGIPEYSSAFTRTLYLLMGIALLVNVLIVLSLVPIRKQKYERSQETLLSEARGSRFFFALLEEGCRLLTPTEHLPGPDQARKRESRKYQGHLVEKSSRNPWVRWPAWWLSVPSSHIFSPYHGILPLIHFPRQLRNALPGISEASCLRLRSGKRFSASVLIIVGLYFAEWARRLFDVRNIVRTLFCATL